MAAILGWIAAIIAGISLVACLVFGHPDTWGIIPNIRFDRDQHSLQECDPKPGEECKLVSVPLPTATPIPPSPTTIPSSRTR